MQKCPRCPSDRLIKNGSTTGKSKKLCTACGYQFTRPTSRGKPLTITMNAIMWSLSGLSMTRIAFLSRVSVPSVLNWIRAFAKDHYEKPQPTGTIIVIERDEMWHYLKKKRQKLWLWKALDPASGQLLDWECGGRDKKTLRKMVDRLSQCNIQGYCTDKLATDASVIPKDKLVQSKVRTHAIERNHCRQRHWFGRFKRRSILVSKSKEMVDLTIALFARFWVNGNQNELVSLLG